MAAHRKIPPAIPADHSHDALARPGIKQFVCLSCASLVFTIHHGSLSGCNDTNRTCSAYDIAFGMASGCECHAGLDSMQGILICDLNKASIWLYTVENHFCPPPPPTIGVAGSITNLAGKASWRRISQPCADEAQQPSPSIAVPGAGDSMTHMSPQKTTIKWN